MIVAKARNASLASRAVGNAAATSGSRTTTELPAAYRDAYLLRGASRKSYSGRISSRGGCCSIFSLPRVFFIVFPLSSSRSPSTDDPDCLAALDKHYCRKAFLRRKTKESEPFLVRRMASVGDDTTE